MSKVFLWRRVITLTDKAPFITHIDKAPSPETCYSRRRFLQDVMNCRLYNEEVIARCRKQLEEIDIMEAFDDEET